MSTNARHAKYVVVMLALGILLVTGMARAMTALAAPPERPPVAPLAAGGPFYIIDHGPVTHAVGVNVAANVTAAFNRLVDASTINSGTWVVHGGFSGVMTGTYLANSDRAGFNPDRNFLTGEQVHVIATSDIRSSSSPTEPLDALQWSFTAGPVQPRCVGGFTVFGAGLPGVAYSSVAWGDYDNDGDLDILLTGYDGSFNRLAKVYRNEVKAGGSFSEDISASAVLTGVSDSSVAWGDYDSDGDLDILLTGESAGGPVAKVYRNEVSAGGSLSDTLAPLTGVYVSSAAWGDYDNDGDLDVLLTGLDSSNNPLAKVYRNEVSAGGSFSDTNAPLTGVGYGSAAWGDYDNDGDLDILLTGSTGGIYVAKVYRNEVSAGGSFSDTLAPLTAVAASSAAWGDYDNDGDLDILLTGAAAGANVAKVYRNEASAGGSFSDTLAPLTGIRDSSAAWGDYDNDGDLDILLTGAYYDGSFQTVTKVHRNEVSAGGSFSDTVAPLAAVSSGSTSWGDYDNDGDLDILLTGLDSGSNRVAKVYRNDDCADLAVGKQAGAPTVRPGAAVTYTIAFTNSGGSPAAGTALTDTLPPAFSLTGVVFSTMDGFTLTQTAGAPEPAWNAGDVPPGAGGLITLTGVMDASLTGTTVTTNTVVATSAASESALANNFASASVTVVEPATLTVTKVVVGPAPGVDWSFSGAPGIGAFALPAGGGSQAFTLDPGAYTVTETVQAEYATSVSCSDGSSGAAQVNLSLAAGEQVNCTFTNTRIFYDLTVTKEGAGSGTVTSDPAAIDCGGNCSASLASGTAVTLTAQADAGSTFAGWSGAVSSSDNPLAVTMDGSKAITAIFTRDQYTLDVSTVGNGSVAKLPNQGTYTFGAEVTLTATADPGWTFAGWSGAVTSSDNPLAVTMDGNKSLIATFTQDQYTLDVSTVGNGSVGRQPDQGTYTFGTDVTLTATAGDGWTFAGWSGAVTSSDNPLAVTMDGSKAITATFTEEGAQEGGVVQGTVVDENDNGIEGVEVTLSEEVNAASAALVSTAITDAAGRYRFENVPAGSYTLNFAAPGYASPDPQPVVVVDGETKTMPPVVLQKEPGSTEKAVYLPTLMR